MVMMTKMSSAVYWTQLRQETPKGRVFGEGVKSARGETARLGRGDLLQTNYCTRNSRNNAIVSDPEIHAPPPQNRRSISRVQNWGWCVFCLFLRFRKFAYHPPPKYRLKKKVFCGDGAWLAVPYSSSTIASYCVA